jgi:hypothetical protein
LQNLKVYETKIKEYQIAIERLKKWSQKKKMC